MQHRVADSIAGGAATMAAATSSSSNAAIAHAAFHTGGLHQILANLGSARGPLAPAVAGRTRLAIVICVLLGTALAGSTEMSRIAPTLDGRFLNNFRLKFDEVVGQLFRVMPKTLELRSIGSAVTPARPRRS